MSHFIRVAPFADLQESACLTVQAGGHTIALFLYGDEVYAVDNRCPHMGFPLDKGTVKDSILTCHWHHARFDLTSGGTFDQWADDVQSFPVELRDGEIWVDVAQHQDPRVRHRDRLAVGLERNLSLVIGKAVMVLLDGGGDAVEPFRIGLEFGTTYRQAGWGQGLTMLTCLMNMLPHLAPDDRPRALYHGLSAVAQDSANWPARFMVRPLPTETTNLAQLKRWFRQFIEVRDAEGAERCIVSAIRAGADDQQMADILFAAVTDHRYIDVGHPADFTNKAFEALDLAGWEMAERVLTSLVRGYANAQRMEESNSWRYPIDLITILHEAFEQFEAVLAEGEAQRANGMVWDDQDGLVTYLLADDPQATVTVMLSALQAGCTMNQLAQTVSYSAAVRIAQFHTSNEFGDWDTALHTFTFANAIQQGLKRAPSPELLRGVFDSAMSVYLDRFLNIPSAAIPQPNGKNGHSALAEFPALLNRQQQVNPAGTLTAHYLYQNNNPADLLAMLGQLLLREDRDFHTIQSVEAAFKQFEGLEDNDPAGTHTLIAASRYLSAHAPTVRAQGQTYRIAQRLHKGEKLFEG